VLVNGNRTQPTTTATPLPSAFRRRYTLAMVAVLAVITGLVAWGWPTLDSFDLRVETAARQFVLDHPGVLAVAMTVTHAADPITINIVVAVGAAILVMYRRLDAALVLVIARVGAGVCVTLMKWLLERARPVWETPLAVVSGYSFPSGHSAGAAATYGTLAVLIWVLGPRAARVPVVVAAALLILSVASSRVLLGVHYTSDVVAGMLVGFLWTLAACIIVARVMRRRTARGTGRAAANQVST
jgi:membrane-associated phospholipid phosphatase